MNIYKDDNGVEYIKDIFNKEDKTIKYNRVAYWERENYLSYEGILNLTLQFNSTDLNKYVKQSNIRKLKYGFNFSNENDNLKFRSFYYMGADKDEYTNEYKIRVSDNNMATICIRRITEKKRIIFSYQIEGEDKITTTKKIFTDDDGIEYIKDFQNQKGFEAVVLNHYRTNLYKKTKLLNDICNERIIDGKQLPEDIQKIIYDYI